jgi:hypothetical protein
LVAMSQLKVIYKPVYEVHILIDQK